jgi:segregation and condensation protein B
MRAEPEKPPVILDDSALGKESPNDADEAQSPEEALEEAQQDEPEDAPQDATGDAEETAPEDEPTQPDTGPELGPGEELEDEELLQRTAALLFASPEPLSEGRLCTLLEKPHPARVQLALESLAERLAGSGLPIVLRAIAGGWRMMTDASQAETIARLVKSRSVDKISPAALETLSIVAYRQPVTKAEIEAIRGVDSGAILRSLVDRGLARVAGRANQPGSPLQYGTTREFLDRFGLASLKDLPRDGELVRG